MKKVVSQATGEVFSGVVYAGQSAEELNKLGFHAYQLSDKTIRVEVVSRSNYIMLFSVNPGDWLLLHSDKTARVINNEIFHFAWSEGDEE